MLTIDLAATAIPRASDEFNDAASINNWSEVHQTEGWGARGAQLNQWTVNANDSGQMVMQPHTVVWYGDWRGPLVFKEITGDFVVTTRMQITDRDDIGGSDEDNVPGDSQFSLGGLMIRTPRAITNGAADWQPGSGFDDGTNNGENYVFLSMGYTSGLNNFSFEVKTTRNSNSVLEITPLGLTPNEVELQIAKIGNSIIALHRRAGEQNWTVHRRYSRPDMPQTMQVGMVTYTDWEKSNDLEPIVHNGSVMTPGQIVDPSPEQPFNPDLTARFEYTRFAIPDVPAEFVGADLSSPAVATDAELLAFLGGNADPNDAPTAVVLTNTTTTLPENTGTSSRIKVADVGVTDDGMGTNVFSLSGADATAFELDGGVLYLQAGTTLDFETKSSYAVTVNVDDSTLGGDPDASTPFTLTLTNVNEAPVVGGFDTTVTYTANGDAVLLDTNAMVADVDTARFGTGVLTISLTANAEADDRLEFRPVTRLIGVSGSNVTFRGTTVGSFVGGTGTDPLVITFNANATISAVQTVLRSVTYRSVSPNPSTSSRTVGVTLIDGIGGQTSNEPTKAINVTVPSLSGPFGATVATVATTPTGLPGVAPAGLLIYYAHPSGINGTFSVNGASAVFSQYPFVVLGGGLEQVGHPDHANTVAIMNHAATADTKFFGYVDLGLSTSNFTAAEIHQRIDAWNVSGADGIFLDDYGYDFGVSRARQNDAVDYAHSVGLPVVANGFFINEVFGNQIEAEFNPGGVGTHLESTDYYLYESYQIRNGVFVDESTWRAKADALAAVRTTLPINVFAVTTNIGASFDQNKLDYAYWSAALDGYTAVGWGEGSFSSNTASAPYRPRPATDPGTAFSSPIDGTSQLFTRDTDAGRIAVDARGFKAGFNQVDFGDAPDTDGGAGPGNYQTTEANDGARHRVGGPRLGASVDFEAVPNVYLEGLVNQPYGYGDNTFGSDEDGVTFTSLLQSSPTTATSGSVVVNVQNTSGTARLDAWLDFNADGDWGDAGEHIFNNFAVVSGDNNLTFTVPMGAASGKTFARFRLSTAGNLTPTGSADDGEVEDHAVLIGGTSSLAVVENAILSHLLPSGVLRSGSGPSFYDRNGQPWYIVDPYFSTIAVRALLAAPNNASVDKFTVAASQLNFWLAHIQQVPSLPGDSNATIPRVIVDQNGIALAANQTVDGTTDGGATYTPYNATMGADADDSALALILSLASEFKLSGGLASVLNAQQANLELVGNTLLSLIGDDGLARPFVDPTNTYTIKQTLDCVEVWQALRQFSVLERDLFLDASAAATYESKADTMSAAIQLLLFDQTSQLYRQHVGADPPDLNTWYPIVFDQAWPIITGLVPANSPTARHLLDEVYAAWDGSPNGSWTTRTDSAWLAWAAAQAGDTALASTAVEHILPWALQNSQPNPATPLTVADLGFLLQALLPAVAGPSVITYVENDAAMPINAGIMASVLDGSTLSGATVTLTNFVSGEDVLSFTNDGATMGNIAETGGTPGVLTLTSAGSSATLAQWQAALRAVKYSNSSDAPTTTRRLVTFTVSDGFASSNMVTGTIDIVAANDAPALTAPSEITFTENDAATAISAGVTVGDSDNSSLAGATVTLTAFVPGQDLLSFANDGATMGNIAVADNANGVLTLVSPGSTTTTAQWQAALRAVKYSNSSDAPTTTQRSVTFAVNDGLVSSNVVTSLIDIMATNDEPAIAGFDTAVTFTANGPTVLLDPNATVSDIDTSRFGGGVLTISLTANAEASDRLDIRQVIRLIGVSGSNVTYRGTTIGTLAGGVGTTDLVVTFNANATESALQAVLRNVTYRSVSANPSMASRTARVTLTDGSGGASNQPTKTINVTAVPIPPPALPLSATSVVLNQPGSTVVGSFSATNSNPGHTSSSIPVAAAGSTDNDEYGDDVLSWVSVDGLRRRRKSRRSP